MSLIKLWSPDGTKCEEHTRANAVDLIRHAGWLTQPPDKAGAVPVVSATTVADSSDAAGTEDVDGTGAAGDDSSGDAGTEDADATGDDASGDAGTEDVGGADATGDDASGDSALTRSDVEKMTQAQLRDLAAKHGVQVDNRWGRSRLIDAVWAAVEQAG